MFNYNKIANYLKNLDNNLPIYITGHKNPDQDSICSCVCLCKTLCSLGKKAKILILKENENILNWKQNIYNFANDINEEEYIFIALDLNDLDRLGAFENFYHNAKIKINIDHHVGNTTNADFVFSLPEISSTCEIIYNIIKKIDKSLITKEISEYLYAGIMTDTNCFTRRLSEKTLQIAQHLINNGIDYSYINKSTHTTRTSVEYKALAYLINNIISNKNYCYVIADKSSEIFKNISHNSLNKKVAEDLRKLDYLHTFILIVKNLDESFTCKVMTDKTSILSANEIASYFGGGGHKTEAGFTVKNTNIDKILEKLSTILE